MLISIHDKTLKRVAYMDNDKPGALHYSADTWHRYLKEATSVFDFTVPKAQVKHPTVEYLTEQSYVSFRYRGHDYLFNVMKIVETDNGITCYTENLNLEMLNETDPAKEASRAMPLTEYLTFCGISYANMTIGRNELAGLTRTLKWESSETKLARLLSVVNSFDGELCFRTELNRDGTLDKIYMDFYREHSDAAQGVGTRRDDVTLYYRKQVDGVEKTTDKTGLYTAILPIGTDDLNISSLNKTEYDNDGNVLFVSAAGDTHILCPSMMTEFPSQLSSDTADRYINLDWTYETDDVNTLYSKALAKLKSIYQPAVTYEITGSNTLDIGDTVTVQDDTFTPALIVEARVSEQVISFSDPTKNKNTYSNFRALESKVSTDLTSRINALIEQQAPYTAELLSDGPTTFLNGSGTVTLTARVRRGTSDVTDTVSVNWYKDDAPVQFGTTLGVSASDVADAPAVFRYDAIVGPAVVCSAQVTVSNVTGGAGAQGVSCTAVVPYYKALDSGSSAPAKPTTANPSDWTKTEPAADTTKNLYMSIKCIYSDYTFTWGDVSLSSTYEAAKAAKTAADNAQTTATSAQTTATSANTKIRYRYGTCSTAAGTAAKVCKLVGFMELYTGASATIHFTNANTATAPTLNVAGTGACAIVAAGDTSAMTSDFYWQAGATVTFVYDGTYWRLQDDTALQKLTPGALTENVSGAIAGDYSIGNSVVNIDKTGLTVNNGGLTIKNSSGVSVFYGDTSGNLTLRGNLQLTGAQALRVDNSSGTQIGQITYTTISGASWSPGALKLRGYDYLSLESGDSTTAKAFGQIAVGGKSVAMFGSETFTDRKEAFFGLGEYGEFFSYKQTRNLNGRKTAERITINGSMYYNGSILPRFNCGSVVVTPSDTSVKLFSDIDVNVTFAVANASSANTAVFVCNADGAASSAHTQDATYVNGTWYATFDRQVTSSMRINYLIAYFG